MGRQRLYRNAKGVTRIHTPGFSWFAAVLLPAWAIRHRLYRTGVAALAIGLTVNVTHRLFIDWQIPGSLTVVFAIVLWVASGVFAPRWQAFVLRRAGYRPVAEERE
jgi:hypothetical protein